MHDNLARSNNNNYDLAPNQNGNGTTDGDALCFYHGHLWVVGYKGVTLSDVITSANSFIDLIKISADNDFLFPGERFDTQLARRSATSDRSHHFNLVAILLYY